MSFVPDISILIQKEGGFSNHKNDLGGPTKYGITELTARQYGYTGKMENLPLPFAKKIYLEEYWFRYNMNLIGEISPTIAQLLFESGVLMGQARVCRYLQRSLNLLNLQATLYLDLVVDGKIGRKTASAMRKYIRKRGSDGFVVLKKCLEGCIRNRFFDITERREKNEDFFFGWMLKRG